MRQVLEVSKEMISVAVFVLPFILILILQGGSLLLCDQCPAAFHAECMGITAPEEGYVCEDCENGKFPVYGDIVWAKVGIHRWWPGQVLHPRYIPDNIENLHHMNGMFCVHFFGSNDYSWVSRGKAFHYQLGDQGSKGSTHKIVEQQFKLALDQAQIEFIKQKEKREQHEQSRFNKGKVKPPPFVRIETNRPVGNVRFGKFDPSQATKCDCDPYSENPCGSDDKCINRMLMIECIREICPTGNRCSNQRFQKRQYPNVFPFRTSRRGWGLKTKDFITKGDFVIEYVGELIDDAEFRRRITEMHEYNEENYYFLTVEHDLMVDAGPKGNLARFMNHSCQPNCQTQKWTVGGDTRVGLFALDDIAADSEVTFNYNLESVGTEKKVCNCGAPLCSGFIGSKVKSDTSNGSKKLNQKKLKKKKIKKLKKTDNDCFRCGTPGDLILCDTNNCPKGYHLDCLSLTSLPKGGWICPWHHCDECGNRATVRCVICPNSFCRLHSTDQFYSGEILVCTDHTEEQAKLIQSQKNKTQPESVLGNDVNDDIKGVSDPTIEDQSDLSENINRDSENSINLNKNRTKLTKKNNETYKPSISSSSLINTEKRSRGRPKKIVIISAETLDENKLDTEKSSKPTSKDTDTSRSVTSSKTGDVKDKSHKEKTSGRHRRHSSKSHGKNSSGSLKEKDSSEKSCDELHTGNSRKSSSHIKMDTDKSSSSRSSSVSPKKKFKSIPSAKFLPSPGKLKSPLKKEHSGGSKRKRVSCSPPGAGSSLKKRRILQPLNEHPGASDELPAGKEPVS